MRGGSSPSCGVKSTIHDWRTLKIDDLGTGNHPSVPRPPLLRRCKRARPSPAHTHKGNRTRRPTNRERSRTQPRRTERAPTLRTLRCSPLCWTQAHNETTCDRHLRPWHHQGAPFPLACTLVHATRRLYLYTTHQSMLTSRPSPCQAISPNLQQWCDDAAPGSARSNAMGHRRDLPRHSSLLRRLRPCCGEPNWARHHAHEVEEENASRRQAWIVPAQYHRCAATPMTISPVTRSRNFRTSPGDFRNGCQGPKAN